MMKRPRRELSHMQMPSGGWGNVGNAVRFAGGGAGAGAGAGAGGADDQ